MSPWDLPVPAQQVPGRGWLQAGEDGGDSTGQCPWGMVPSSSAVSPSSGVWGTAKPLPAKKRTPSSALGASPGDGAVPSACGVAGSAQGHLGGLGCQTRTGISPVPKGLLVGSPKPKFCRSTCSGSIWPDPSRSPSRFPLGKINGHQEPAPITGSHCCILSGDKTSRAVTGAGSATMLHSGWQGTSVAGGRRGWQGPCGQGEALDPAISMERSLTPPQRANWGQKGFYFSLYWSCFFPLGTFQSKTLWDFERVPEQLRFFYFPRTFFFFFSLKSIC